MKIDEIEKNLGQLTGEEQENLLALADGMKRNSNPATKLAGNIIESLANDLFKRKVIQVSETISLVFAVDGLSVNGADIPTTITWGEIDRIKRAICNGMPLEVVQFLKNGNRMQAISRFRTFQGIPLSEAKNKIEEFIVDNYQLIPEFQNHYNYDGSAKSRTTQHSQSAA